MPWHHHYRRLCTENAGTRSGLMAGCHGYSPTSTVEVLLGFRGIFQTSHDELPVIEIRSLWAAPDARSQCSRHAAGLGEGLPLRQPNLSLAKFPNDLLRCELLLSRHHRSPSAATEPSAVSVPVLMRE